MCYHYGRAIIYDEQWRRARKEHFCQGCGRAISRGEQYVAASSLYDGRWSNWNECERCRYYLALLYAQERSEGCLPHESWCAIGDLYEDMRDRGWVIPYA